MNMHPTTTTDDSPREPEPVGDSNQAEDPRHLAPDADDDDVEEAGYGYGV
jgi:hypothetical protein